jgi:hypothetical protein
VRPAVLPEPVRRSDRLAPQQADLPARPSFNPSGGLAELAGALSGIVPSLNTAFEGFMRGRREAEGAEADADATQAAMQSEVRTWADAVKANPELADRSPFYRRVYEERLARTAIQRRGNEVFGRYWASPAASSTDPNAVNEWMREQFRDVLEGLNGNPSALAAAAEELRSQSTQLLRAHQQNATRNLVARNESSFDSAVGAVFDEAAQRRWSNDQIHTRLTQLQAEALAQGVDGATINRVMSSQLGEAMVRHGRSDLAELGSRARPDGTPGFATTAQGRGLLENARSRIQSAAVQASNLAYTQERRRLLREGQEASTAAVRELLTAADEGRRPEVSSQTIARLASIDRDLAGWVINMGKNIQDWDNSRRENPMLSATLELEAARGTLQEMDLLGLHAQGQIGPEAFRRLARTNFEAQNSTILNDGAVQSIIQSASRFAGDPEGMSGVFRNPLAATQIETDLRRALVEYRAANPGKTHGEVVVWLQEEANRRIPSYVPGARLRELQRTIDSTRSAAEQAAANAVPIQFPEAAIQLRPGTGGADPVPMPYRPGRMQPTQGQLQALVTGLRTNPNDLALIEAFDRQFGANAAHHFISRHNREVNQRSNQPR